VLKRRSCAAKPQGESQMKTLQACLLAGCAMLLPAHADETYDPKIDPANFSSKITHPLFTMPIAKVMTFEGKTEDGLEHETIKITGETRIIMGVETLVALDTVMVDGTIVEIAKDYLAQDKDGNVWYFGEDVDNFENGKLKDHHGAWLAGTKGAKPGIWMPAQPVPGLTYRQEFYKGEAEDMAEVLETKATVKVASGSYDMCTVVHEWTPLEPGSNERKYYCPAAGGQVLGENLLEKSRAELIKVTLQ
jgi:hypothetical protein